MKDKRKNVGMKKINKNKEEIKEIVDKIIKGGKIKEKENKEKTKSGKNKENEQRK